VLKTSAQHAGRAGAMMEMEKNEENDLFVGDVAV
jgi:hypothetical protein